MLKKGLKRLLSMVYEKRLTTVTGAWVYYFLTCAVPLAFLLITAFGVFGVSVTNEIVSRLPEEFRPAGQTLVSVAENASNGVTVFFVITVIFSCTTLLNQMSKDGDYIYGVNSKTKRGVMRRVWAVVALGVLFTLFLGSALLFAFSKLLFSGVFVSGITKLMITVLIFFVVVWVGFIVILLLNKFIAPVKLKFSQNAMGSLFSLSIVVLGTILHALYLRFFSNDVFYGSLAAIVAFLIWAYILMFGLVTGVIINAYAYQKGKDKKV